MAEQVDVRRLRIASGAMVLRIELDLVATDRGGRRRPLADGYRASMSFGRRRRDVEPIVHDAILVLEGEATTLEPGGGRDRAGVGALARRVAALASRAGTVFTLLENDRIVARASVLGVYDDPTPFPVRDLRAAKSRPLVDAG